MIPYNTDYNPIRLPEFGRTIQSLIDYCVAIPDREERTDCAFSIANVMGNMFPELKGDNNDMSKIWDQMMIMSQFRLDVDFPCEVITQEKFKPDPRPIPQDNSKIRLKHYGKYIQKMIPVIADMPDGEAKDELISNVAHHMKKLMMFQNKDWVDDGRILRDMAMYSDGMIDLNPEEYVLHEFMEAPVAKPVKKKKRKTE